MNERETEVTQEEVSIRTGLKAGDDGSQIGSGNATGSQIGTGNAAGSQMGSGH